MRIVKCGFLPLYQLQGTVLFRRELEGACEYPKPSSYPLPGSACVCLLVGLNVFKRQGFVAKNIARYEKVGWCVTKYSYFDDVFRRANQWLRMVAVAKTRADANTLYVPRAGDYLRTDSHSMLIVGTSFDDGASSPEQNLRLHIVEGNMDHGAPEDSGKRVRYRSILASAHNLSGVGRKNLPTVTE